MKKGENTILITGGSSGIGLEMARQLSRAGNRVIVTGRNAERLAKAAAEVEGLVTLVSDVSDPVQIRELAGRIGSEFPETNVLINNAGIMWRVDLLKHEYPLEELTSEVDINLKGPIQMVDAFLPHLKSVGEAAIVNVSSGLAFVPLPISAVYCSTKAAIHSYTQSLRVQLSDTSIKVFELMPPATKTALMDTFKESDMEGVSLMSPEKVVEAFVTGFGKDEFEIRPGQANQLRFMSRFFPAFILKQMGKTVDGMRERS